MKGLVANDNAGIAVFQPAHMPITKLISVSGYVPPDFVNAVNNEVATSAKHAFSLSRIILSIDKTTNKLRADFDALCAIPHPQATAFLVEQGINPPKARFRPTLVSSR